MTSARRTHANRSEDRPHPGRRHGGQTKAVATGVEDRTSSNKFLGQLPPPRQRSVFSAPGGRDAWRRLAKTINDMMNGRAG